MDPLESIKFDSDTTFMLMLGAHRRGHHVYYVAKDGIRVLNGQVTFHAIKVIPQHIMHQPFIEEHAILLHQKDVHAVFIRPDPPFNEQYLINTWLLDLLPNHVAVINKASGIRHVNEKIWCSRFHELVPPTLISSNAKDLKQFIESHKTVIAKPTNGFGGQRVFKINHQDTNANVILETLTDRFNTPIILQRYIEDSKNGDKRILLLNGEFLGAVLRVHGEGDHRNNFYAGGTPVATTLNDRDKHIINCLKPYLRELGLYFVGIDILGDYLIEVNVTSPTCLQEMNNLYNMNLENNVINFVEQICQKN
jgi:glutathione synthase